MLIFLKLYSIYDLKNLNHHKLLLNKKNNLRIKFTSFIINQQFREYTINQLNKIIFFDNFYEGGIRYFRYIQRFFVFHENGYSN